MNNNDMKLIKQRVNYAHLGTKLNKKLSSSSISDCQLPISNNVQNFNLYIKRNRKNTLMFSKLLFEFSNFFYQKQKYSSIAAFVHLYRCIEYISYCFPLVYTSKAGDYKGTYDALKSFFSEEQKSELKFFKVFQNTLVDATILNLQLSIDIKAPDANMRNEFERILDDLCIGIPHSINSGSLTINYANLFDLIISLRNRYFHMLAGDNKKNIDTIKANMDYLFDSVNDHIANWIAFIYFEITRFGVENIS